METFLTRRRVNFGAGARLHFQHKGVVLFLPHPQR